MRRCYGSVAPVEPSRVVEAPDGFRLELAGRSLLFLDTPGHARHHVCVWDEASRGMFTGDTFGVSYRELASERGAFILPTTTPVQFEPEALHGSVDRLLGFEPRVAYLTHYSRVGGRRAAGEPSCTVGSTSSSRSRGARTGSPTGPSGCGRESATCSCAGRETTARGCRPSGSSSCWASTSS